MDIHFIPLNYILPARWTNNVMAADGTELFRLLEAAGDDWQSVSVSQRNKYLRQFPHSIKPSAEAASEVNQWVARSQTKTLSPIDK